MKKIGSLLAILSLAVPCNAFAWVGGPYSNNTYDGLDGGIFSGTIRGKRCSGIFKFSQGGEAYVSPFGDSILYFKGIAYYGESYGMVDFASKTITGVTNGSAGQSNTADPNGSPLYRSVFGSGYGAFNGSGAGNPNVGVASNTNVSGGNCSYNGKITKSKPSVRFKAKGEATFFGNGDTSTTTQVVNSEGDFFLPRVDPLGGLINNAEGSRVSTTTTANDFPKVSDVIKIKVYGGRTSIFPFNGPTGYAG